MITSKKRGIDEEKWENNFSYAFVANVGDDEKIVCFEHYGISVFSFENLRRERRVNLRNDDFANYFRIERDLRGGNWKSLQDYVNCRNRFLK